MEFGKTRTPLLNAKAGVARTPGRKLTVRFVNSQGNIFSKLTVRFVNSQGEHIFKNLDY